MRKKRMRYWSRDRPKTRDTKQRHPKHPDPNTKSKFKLMEVPVMKHLKRIFALCLVLALSLMIIPAAFAAPAPEATIDPSRTGSLSVFKYDITKAEADGVWDSSYVSTGVYDESGVNAVLGNPAKENALGNGDVSYGYAVKGVEFTYLRIADISTFSQTVVEDGQTVNRVSLLYGFPVNSTSSMFFEALGISTQQRVIDADNTVDGVQYYYFTSDVLIAALESSMEHNAADTRTALENYVLSNGGTTMPETDSFGHTYAEGLELGLYLVVETKVPEMITCTTTPFLASLPMTTVNGGNADNGGEEWLYDITIYPKNTSGNPDLVKTVRESKPDTGKNNGSTDDIHDGFEHTATGSAGDVMDYQIISTLPTITSKATYLSTYTFQDVLSKGITYNRSDVILEFFRDADCTDKVTTWRQTDSVEMFQVSYANGENSSETMTISMTEAGLKEINTSKLVYPADTMVNSGFSGCTLRITYAATVNSDADLVLGDEGNPNEVTLTWKRSNSSYYDTLRDDCHVYSYGIDLLKQFSDGAGKLENVEFVVKNSTDNYFVQAQYDETAKVYYVTGHAEAEADATHFIPSADGHIFVRGLEDDTYILTEVKTDNGYSLLKNDIEIVISTEDGEICEICGEALKVASATVNGKPVTMNNDGESVHAVVPLSVTNMKGFDLPKTGDRGTWMYGVLGAALVAASGLALFFALRKRKTEQ